MLKSNHAKKLLLERVRNAVSERKKLFRKFDFFSFAV